MEVAEPVVDRLELVEVHHQQAEPTARTGAAGDLALERREEEAAVEEPVSGSIVERRMAASRVRRCSRAMTIAT